MLKLLLSGIARRLAQQPPPPEPFDHPEIRRMSVAERADLPSHRWCEGT